MTNEKRADSKRRTEKPRGQLPVKNPDKKRR